MTPLTRLAWVTSLACFAGVSSECKGSSSLSGDYNQDGLVSGADYTVWRSALGGVAIPGAGADGNGNGVIDVDDYNVWAANYDAIDMPIPGFVASSDGSSVLNGVEVAVVELVVADAGVRTWEMRVTKSAPGPIAIEAAVSVDGTLVPPVFVDTALFDDANPGANPFIPGTAIGGDTFGLDADLVNNRLFASYGGPDFGTGAFTFLTFSTTDGDFRRIDFTATVSQNGIDNRGFAGSVGVPEPSSLLAVFAVGVICAAKPCRYCSI